MDDSLPQTPLPEPPIQQPQYQLQNAPLSSLFTPKVFLALGIVLIFILGGVLFLGKKSSPVKKNPTPSIPVYVKPSLTPTPIIYPTSWPDTTTVPSLQVSITPITTSHKLYSGNYVTFSYPAAWSPKVGYVGGGSTLENVTLGIPNVLGDQTMSFSDVSVSEAKPKDVVKETAIIMGGKKGFKWLRKGTNYTSYDYITPGYQNKGSFSIHVTLSKEDTTIETLLDALSQSVVFK